MTLELDTIGNIVSWETRFGNVIHPRTREENKWRGGSHANLPVQGKVPSNKPIWAGVSLDQHGFLRNGREFFRGEESSGLKRIFTFAHEAREAYPWSLEAELEFRTFSGEDCEALTYSLTVTRSRNCPNARAMPYSMGLHPYFTVQEGGFELLIGDTKVMEKGECETNLPKFFALEAGWPSVTFVTGKLHLSFIIHGADELIVWTDELKRVCIEPVSGRRKDTTLEKGQSHQLLIGLIARQA